MLRQLWNRINKLTGRRGIILMYHQVCERKNDPWELAVCPRHFDAQLAWLRNHFEVVSLSEMAECLATHRLRNMVAITFDGGFSDNYSNAAPLLDWYAMPATFHLAPSAMRPGHIYWWDALQDVIFHTPVLPRDFEMTLGEATVSFRFTSDWAMTNRLHCQIQAWNYTLPIPNERIALHMLLWHHIKPLDYATQQEALRTLRTWAGHEAFIAEPNVTMNVREMQMLSENPLFSIGAHTVHHCTLPARSALDQAFEVRESKRQIETWLGKRIDGFAYPYGEHDDHTRSLLREAGFRYAVSGESKPLRGNEDLFALPRIQVKNWCVYEFATRLKEMING